MNHQELIERSHKQAVDKGFWVKPLTFDMAMALIISEIAEALEAYRKGRVNPDWNDTQTVKESFEVEIADAIIRIYDWVGGNGLSLTRIKSQKKRFTEEEGHNFMMLFEASMSSYLRHKMNNSDSLSMVFNTLIDYCEFKSIDIEKYIEWKLDYNLNREYLHGKKF